MTAKKVVDKPIRKVLGYVLLENCNDGDVTAGHVPNFGVNDVDLWGTDLFTKGQLEVELKAYDGSRQLLVGEVCISHITVRTLKEI